MTQKLPLVSVVIPAYNEELMLPTSLESLRDQDYKGKYEVIVVNNSSSDLTPKVAAVYGARVVTESLRGVSRARQTGFLKAKGTIILSTDADTILPPDWITRMVKELTKDKKIVGVAGSCNLIGINTPLKLLAATLIPVVFALDKIMDYPGTLQGWNFGVKKEAFLKIGGFNTKLEFAEDRDLGKRLRKVGKVKVLYKIKVKTSARRFMGFIRTFKYVFVNYVYFSVKRKYLKGTFSVIRQKSYESYDVFNDRPFFLMILTICFLLIIFLTGAVPFIGIWSTSSVKAQSKIIALTFDETTQSSDTEQILQVLKSENVPATFFISGAEVKKNPAILKEIYSDGNQIGNHASSQNVLAMLKTPGDLVEDINTTDNLIYKTIGVKPKFFRPTRGYRTIWGALSLDKYGYQIITWSATGGDMSQKPDSKQIAINVIKSVKPGGIIDITDNGNQTARATEEIVDLLTADGYKFVTMDKLLGKPAYFNN